MNKGLDSLETDHEGISTNVLLCGMIPPDKQDQI
jgi:hypothetical protein